MNKKLPPGFNVKKLQVLKGMGYGCQAPSILIMFTLPAQEFSGWESSDWQKLDNRIAEMFNIDCSGQVSEQRQIDSPGAKFITKALDFSSKVMRSAGAPIFEFGRILSVRSNEKEVKIVASVPYHPPYSQISFQTFLWSLRVLLAFSKAELEEDVKKEIESSYQRFLVNLKPLQSGQTNTLRFLSAANELKIPWMPLISPYYQIGWGKNQGRLNSSITQLTPDMGVTVAKNKFQCGMLLRLAGLPVPDDRVAKSAEDAVQLSEQLGYPVVIKPANKDGGLGVASGLTNAEQVTIAWEEARKISKFILVQKHLHGRDYRLQVIDGNLEWALTRKPAGITGDGKHTVEELIAIANEDPRRGHDAQASLRPLTINREAEDLLVEQKFDRNSVLDSGVFVCLRRAANISSGGTPEGVMDQVHPDNRLLAVNAASVLGLDLAGIDLIIPDIARSWRDVGGGIIEINAQPQLVAASQTHLYGKILEARVRRGGRIPLIVVVGEEIPEHFIAELTAVLDSEWSEIGVSRSEGLIVSGTPVSVNDGSIFSSTMFLLMNKVVGAGIICISDAKVLEEGLPFDRFDVLITIGELNADNGHFLRKISPLLVPHCSGLALLCNSQSNPKLSGRGISISAGHQLPADSSKVVSAVATYLKKFGS